MKQTSGSPVGLLLRFARGVKRLFVLAVLANCASILANFMVPQVIRITVDSVIGAEPFALPAFLLRALEGLGGRAFLRTGLIYCAAAVAVLSLLTGLFGLLTRMLVAKSTEKVIMRMRNALYEHTQRLPFKWHMEHLTGDIIQRCTSDMDVVRDALAKQLMEVIRTAVLVTAALILMFSMNVKLSLIALSFIPVVLGYSLVFFAVVSKKFRRADEAEGELMVRVQENLTGVRVVRAFGRERHEIERFDRVNDRFAQLWIDLGYTLGAYWGVGDVVTGAQVLAVVAAGAVFAGRGEITLGQFIVFCSYTNTLAWPVRHLGRVLSEISKTGVSLRRIKDILDARPEEEEPGALKPDLDCDITFEHVSFSYDSQEVLSDLSFTVERGSTFGILGSTGSGKSTVTYLLNRLYDLDESGGRILMGGVDIKQIDRAHLRRNVGLVLQEPFLFSKTIGENIGIAARSRDLHEVRRHARTAAVDEAIMSFAKGYDTIVGERGITLSGGQKQRVAIARTLMTGAPILIFDDSMSAVDLETDARIRAELREKAAGATVILISHRINTLMYADKIMVLDGGRMQELGTHEELLKNGGTYARVYAMQASHTADLPEGEGERA